MYLFIILATLSFHIIIPTGKGQVKQSCYVSGPIILSGGSGGRRTRLSSPSLQNKDPGGGVWIHIQGVEMGRFMQTYSQVSEVQVQVKSQVFEVKSKSSLKSLKRSPSHISSICSIY